MTWYGRRRNPGARTVELRGGSETSCYLNMARYVSRDLHVITTSRLGDKRLELLRSRDVCLHIWMVRWQVNVVKFRLRLALPLCNDCLNTTVLHG